MYAALICPIHGQVFISQEEYLKQLQHVNGLWRCPHFETELKFPFDKMTIGRCGEACEFDDDYWELNHEVDSRIPSKD